MKRASHNDRTIDAYLPIIGHDVVDELRNLSHSLRGKKIVHINATPVGGGVAEILKSQIPLLRSLDIDAEWWTLEASDEFFAITKRMHNGLQSADVTVTDEDWQLYLDEQQKNAADLPEADLVIVHDPQPMAVPSFVADRSDAWVWRLHVDSSTPNEALWHRLSPLLQPYSRAIFTLKQFVPEDVTRRVKRGSGSFEPLETRGPAGAAANPSQLPIRTRV